MNDLSSQGDPYTQLRLHLLGYPQVTLDGQLVTAFKSSKAQATLFYAAVSKRPRSRAEMAAMLWPEVDDDRANTSLRTALSNLRRLLGGHLEITRQTVALKPGSNTSVDVAQFDTLLRRGIDEAPDILQIETAVSLYEGDFLEGFHLPDAPLFEHWAAAEGTRLRGALLGALHTLALWHAERSEYQASLDYLARLLALDPIREVGHRLKMAVLALTGQRGAALNHFHVGRRIRSEQLGLDPTPETIALYELILHDRFPGEVQPPISELIADTQSRGIDAGVAAARERSSIIRSTTSRKTVNVDWDDMPASEGLFGRRRHLDQLLQWLTDGKCRLVAIVGQGGIGKTALAAEVTRLMVSSTQIRSAKLLSPREKLLDNTPFDQIIWRSLVNTPPMAAVLNDWLQVLPDQKFSEIPGALEAKLSLLHEELKRQRCLLILDNAESVLKEEVSDGQGESVLEGYHHLIRLVANSFHQSCLLLTSREIPPGVKQRAADSPEVQLLQLDGLPVSAGADLLRSRGLDSPSERLESIVKRYSGNPLALKLVAETVRELFAGDVEEFLHDETLIFGDIRDVLDQQYERLPDLEREILTWLAVEREPVLPQVLWDDLAYPPHRHEFLEALRSLQRRSLLELSSSPVEGARPQFTLQNVVTEYLTSRLVESVCDELKSGSLLLFQRHALVKVHTKEYVEDSQKRLLLRPVSEWLQSRLGSSGAVERLRDLLAELQAERPGMPGYGVANILHLLSDMNTALQGYDFSQLPIWQADLRDAILINTSFRGSDLKGSLFRDTFGLVKAVAVSPDGQIMASANSDGSVVLWKMTEYQPYRILKQHTATVNSIAFSQDGSFLVSASADRTIRLWEVATGKVIQTLRGHRGSVLSIALSTDGYTLFSGSEDRMVGEWDVWNGQFRRWYKGVNTEFHSLAFSPNAATLVGGDEIGFLYFWDALSGTLEKKMRGHERTIQVAVFSPDGRLLVTGGEDNQIHIWNVQDRTKLRTFSGHKDWVFSAALSPDGKILASGSADKTIRLWDFQTADTIRILRGGNNWITSVAITPDGRRIAGGSYDRRIRLWDVHSGRLLHSWRGSLRWIDQVVSSPDGRFLASASFDKSVLMWDVQAGKFLRRLQGHQGSIRRLAFSPDSKTLAAGSDDYTVRLWDTQNGSLKQTLTGHGGFVRTLAFSPDGRWLAAGGMDGVFILWDVSSGRPRFTSQGIRMGLKLSACFSPDGKLLAFSRTDDAISLLEVGSGQVADEDIEIHAPVQLLLFSPSGALFAYQTQDGVIRVSEVKDGSVNAVQPRFGWQVSGGKLWNLAFHPKDCYLAAQGDEETIICWDLKDGRQCFSIKERLNGERCMDFSRDGKFLVTGGIDGNLRMWESASGELHHTLKGHNAVITSISINSRGEIATSSSEDGTIRVWDLTSGSCSVVLNPPGPYEGTDITGATGLNPAQRAALRTLGAVDSDPS